MLLATTSIYATVSDGIRIESPYPVIVCIDGEQINTPAQTCFIANLRRGHYLIEVYEDTPNRPTANRRPGSSRTSANRQKKGKLLFKEKIFFSGSGVEDIFVDQEDIPENDLFYGNVMSDKAFEDFLRVLKKEPFDDHRKGIIEMATQNSLFTSEQCKKILSIYNFDDRKIEVIKMLYPKVVDKQNFFIVLETMTFGSNKDKVNEIIKKYHKENEI